MYIKVATDNPGIIIRLALRQAASKISLDQYVELVKTVDPMLTRDQTIELGEYMQGYEDAMMEYGEDTDEED